MLYIMRIITTWDQPSNTHCKCLFPSHWIPSQECQHPDWYFWRIPDQIQAISPAEIEGCHHCSILLQALLSWKKRAVFPLWQVCTLPPIAAGSGRLVSHRFWMKEECVFFRARRACPRRMTSQGAVMSISQSAVNASSFLQRVFYWI